MFEVAQCVAGEQSITHLGARKSVRGGVQLFSSKGCGR